MTRTNGYGRPFAAMKFFGMALLGPVVLAGCGEMNDTEADVTQASGELATDAFNNSTGQARTVVRNPNGTLGSIDTSPTGPNNFFKSIGTNGRACVSCHQPAAGWTITPSQVQAVFNATQGNDPLFRLNDGANNPNAPVATLAQRSAAYSLVRTKGLIRIGLDLPANREFDITRIVDPYGFQTTSATNLSFYRRPLPSANLKFLSGVMWDGREKNGATMRDRLLVQANDATRGHAQSARDLTAAEAAQIVDFQLSMFVAQETDNVAGRLGPVIGNDTSSSGALGGPLQLSRQAFNIGINDVLTAGFDKNAFTVYNAWQGLSASTSNNRRMAIQRGQQIFNTKPIRIQGVRGVNDKVQGDINATLDGTCTTCHDSPNVGNHSVALPLDLGLTTAAQNGDNALPLFTVRRRSNGEQVETTDLGVAMIDGTWAHLATFKGPILHSLAARPPYFHNGSAATLSDVIRFYDTRFHIGFQAQELADLQAFLESI
jgi:cytochrome c peroxidase